MYIQSKEEMNMIEVNDTIGTKIANAINDVKYDGIQEGRSQNYLHFTCQITGGSVCATNLNDLKMKIENIRKTMENA